MRVHALARHENPALTQGSFVADYSTAGDVVDFLLSDRADRALEEVGLTRSRDLDTMKNVQFIELGPELLVYLDAVKRSRFLDTWFQLVIQD